MVGSTDAHSVLDAHTYFQNASTVVFSKTDHILDAIAAGYSVAAEHLPGENTRIYGPFRLVKYAQFLFFHYFPIHNALCNAAGQTIMGYLCGTIQKETVESLERSVLQYEKRFFGRS